VKKILILSIFALMLSGAYAQNRPERKMPTAAERIEKVAEELGLSDAQVEQWEAIHEENGEPPRDRSKMKAFIAKMDKELTATLTDEQKIQFEKMKKDRKKGPPPRK